MTIRSTGWLLCLFATVVTASECSEPVSRIGSIPKATDNGLRTDKSEWSMMEPGQKLDMMGGSPAFAAMLERRTMRTSSSQGSVEEPVTRRLLTSLKTDQAPYIFPQLPNIDPKLPNTAPQIFKMPERASQLPEMAPKPPSSPSTDATADLNPGCRKQHLSVETAVATAVAAMKESCDDLSQDAVDFIKDHLGQVLATEGWAHTVRTQPEEVVQLSRLLMAVQLAETSMTATTTTDSTTSSQPEADRSQTATTTLPPEVFTCPNSPLDENVISRLRTMPEETKLRDLIMAAKSGDIQQIRYLLAGGASLEARDMGERTALQWAAWTGSVEAASCLLAAGADPDTSDDEGYRPLHRAAMAGHADMVRLLAAAGADLNAQDE